MKINPLGIFIVNLEPAKAEALQKKVNIPVVILRDLLKRTENFEEKKKPRVYIGGIGFRGTQGIESTEARYFPLDWVRARNLAKKIAPRGHLFVEKEFGTIGQTVLFGP